MLANPAMMSGWFRFLSNRLTCILLLDIRFPNSTLLQLGTEKWDTTTVLIAQVCGWKERQQDLLLDPTWKSLVDLKSGLIV